MYGHEEDMKGRGRMLWRNPAALTLHLSFVLILAGAICTWLLQERGAVRLSPGEKVVEFRSSGGGLLPLPVALELDSFRVEYYPGGIAPRDYVSYLKVDGRHCVVSMNRILTTDGYRFCQSGYDTDGSTVLSVNHDPWGIALVYSGFVMFTVAGLWVLLSRRCRWRSLLRSLSLLAILASPGFMSASSVKGVPAEVADSLRSRQVVYQGRVVTFNTLSREVVAKLHGAPSYRGLSPEQTLLSMRLYPEAWKSQPLLLVKDKNLRSRLGVEGKYVAIENLFDSASRYRIVPLLSVSDKNMRRAMEELDEKVGIILSLYSGDLIVEAGEADGLMPQWRVDLELLYNRIPFSTLIFILLFSGAAISFTSLSGRRLLRSLSGVTLWAATALSAVCFALQWILSNHIPLSNTYETLLFAVLALEILIIIARRQGFLLRGLAMTFAGALALVAHLMEVNPVVTPLMPVLHSPWLSLHVSLVMTSYALLGLTFVAAAAAIISPAMGERMRRISLAALYPAEWLLGFGIITGAVWANISWGRYWSWDPKETLALVTFIVYALPLHRSIPLLRSPRRYHVYMLLSILTVAMTYFGVNLLPSLHAYN